MLNGGLITECLYLLKGAPGTGKTTLGLQFLLEGAKRGEKCLYLGLSETRGQLDALASSFGWSLDGVDIHDMRRRGESDKRSSYTVFSPGSIEVFTMVGMRTSWRVQHVPTSDVFNDDVAPTARVVSTSEQLEVTRDEDGALSVASLPAGEQNIEVSAEYVVPAATCENLSDCTVSVRTHQELAISVE